MYECINSKRISWYWIKNGGLRSLFEVSIDHGVDGVVITCIDF